MVAFAVAYLGKAHIYWVTSGYSQKSFLLFFDAEPSEEDLTDAVIDREPLFADKDGTKNALRKAQVEGNRLFVKLDGDRALSVTPFSPDLDPAPVCEGSDGHIKGAWLTEPSTRTRVPPFLARTSYFLFSVFGIIARLLLVRWSWYFMLARVKEFSRAIEGK